jgi:hypothetical protein
MYDVSEESAACATCQVTRLDISEYPDLNMAAMRASNPTTELLTDSDFSINEPREVM